MQTNHFKIKDPTKIFNKKEILLEKKITPAL